MLVFIAVQDACGGVLSRIVDCRVFHSLATIVLPDRHAPWVVHRRMGGRGNNTANGRNLDQGNAGRGGKKRSRELAVDHSRKDTADSVARH